TVRNSKFYGNSIYDIFVQDNSGPIDTITLENNWFAAPVGTTGQPNGTTVAFSTVPPNVKIRNNSFNAQMSLDDNGTNPTYVGWTIEGNVGPLQYNGCTFNGIAYRYNAWTNRACGSTDVNLNGPVPYVNAGNGATADYHLTGGRAVDLIPAANLAVAKDIDGDTRPMGGGGDAGSDERGGSAPTPPPPPGDTTPPDTTVTSGPAASTTATSASFSFSGSEAGSTTACRLDAGAWGACTSPKTYSPVAVGSHTFEVRATDAAGNTDPSPASRSWTVTAPPAGGGSTLYMSTTGSDANACTQAAPCKTLTRAYRVAAPGQTVEVAAGTYADTSLPVDAAKTSTADVVFAPAAGAAVTFSGALHIAAKHLELKGMRFTAKLFVDATAEDVTVRDGDMKTFDLFSDAGQAPKDISFIGGDLGPSVDDNNRIGSNGTSTTASPQNILIDGVRVHDFTLSAGSSAHVECLQVWAAQGLTIRNSRFENCEVFDVFLQKLPGGAAATPSNILIENNVMDCCRSGYFAIRLADHAGTSWKDITIRNNSLDKAINPDAGVPYSNVKIVGNIGPKVDFYTGATGGAGSKPAGLTVDYNVWYAGAKAGVNDRVAPSGYRDAAKLDFHLVAGAAGIDHGDPANAPATDMDGDARPQGSAPDAGADEVAGGSPPPPPPPPADTAAPSVPANVRSTGVTASSVSLAWNASTDTGGSGVKGYTVYRNGVALNAAPQTGTTFTDGGLSASTTFSYTVKAVDNAGNVSAASSAVSATTSATSPAPPPPATLTFAPSADAQLRKTRPSSNYGTASRFRVAASPVYDTLIAFNVGGIGTRTVTSAKLRLWAYEGSTNAGVLRKTATGWQESAVNWSTAPAPSATEPATQLGAVKTGAWLEADVTKLVTRDGAISLRLTGAGGDSATFNARESATNRPQLIVAAQ
ncbi:MAG: hypothetical protein JWO02_2922, partial [Solirubrobacterales bacterium]|nr:hypothetical protein [Solirubrobacterales bacterium]